MLALADRTNKFEVALFWMRRVLPLMVPATRLDPVPAPALIKSPLLLSAPILIALSTDYALSSVILPLNPLTVPT